jgi:hypothetical protein
VLFRRKKVGIMHFAKKVWMGKSVRLNPSASASGDQSGY